MPYYTDLGVVFEALGGRHVEYNWLITGMEYGNLDRIVMPPELALVLGSSTYEFPDLVWLSGKRLGEIIGACNLQFNWAVLSGFEPHVGINLTNLEVYPFADGNPEFWRAGAEIQHPSASVEIVCWDSSCTLLLSKDDDLTRRFREFFPEACDLDNYNRSRGINRPQIG